MWSLILTDFKAMDFKARGFQGERISGREDFRARGFQSRAEDFKAEQRISKQSRGFQSREYIRQPGRTEVGGEAAEEMDQEEKKEKKSPPKIKPTSYFLILIQIRKWRHNQTGVLLPEHYSRRLHMSLDNQKEAKGHSPSLEPPKSLS